MESWRRNFECHLWKVIKPKGLMHCKLKSIEGLKIEFKKLENFISQNYLNLEKRELRLSNWKIYLVFWTSVRAPCNSFYHKQTILPSKHSLQANIPCKQPFFARKSITQDKATYTGWLLSNGHPMINLYRKYMFFNFSILFHENVIKKQL